MTYRQGEEGLWVNDRTLSLLRVVMVLIVCSGWLFAVVNDRSSLLVDGPMMAALAFVFRVTRKDSALREGGADDAP